METKEKPKPTPDYLMQLMNDKKLMSSLPNFCGIFNHLERLLDEGKNLYEHVLIFVKPRCPLFCVCFENKYALSCQYAYFFFTLMTVKRLTFHLKRGVLDADH